MSWIKRRGQAASPNPSAAPPVQMYNPNQHSNLQTQWQQQDLQPPSNNWYSQPQTNQQQKSFAAPNNYTQPTPQPQQPNYWQQPYNNQQTGQVYNQNATNQYNQQYSQYGQSQQPGYYENNTYQQQQPNYTSQQPQIQPYGYGTTTPNHVEQPQLQPDAADTWNWGWGDEDNSNVQSLPPGNSNANTNPPATSTDGFAADESWNWSVEDTNTNSDVSNNKNQAEPYASQNYQGKPDPFVKVGGKADKINHSPDLTQSNLKDLNEQRAAYAESLSASQVLVSSTSPKHSKPDHLTPQWSTESQLSQDSSDLLHTSESDKSHMLSRSSTISESPISGHDPNPEPSFLAAPSGVSRQGDASRTQQFEVYTTPETPAAPEPSASSTVYYKQDSFSLLQQENREVLTSMKDDLRAFKSNPTPPPAKNHTPPLVPLPPSSSSGDDSRNPYKRTSGLSHKSASKFKTTDRSQQGFYLPNQAGYPVSASPFGQSVNLETLPDNSEQPDSVPHQNQPRKVSTSKAPTPMQQWAAENNEVAPMNDRNQYLETGQLSNNDGFNQGDHVNQPVVSSPPPGFTRMVLGQMEQPDNGAGNQDEPPPGLSRMVLGGGGSGAGSGLLRGDANDLPVGLHRMVPGESSSPEIPVVSRPTPGFQLPVYGDADGDVSESELNQPVASQVRSATIGADTPPVGAASLVLATANRSETIGADITLPYSSTTSSDSKKSSNQVHGYNSGVRETNADGANNLDEAVANTSVQGRRDSIEGQPRDGSPTVASLVNAVRDLTVGENTTDGASGNAGPDRSTRRSSTDSEHEHESRGKSRKDRKYHEYDREKARSRYSPAPEQYRDKKHDRRRYKDRRYEEDTDYFSDKERDRRREDKDRREEFDRKYSSLKRDKEKDRKRREPRESRTHRDYGRDGRRTEYYGRYEDDYEEPTTRSRPSSRSDSMHDSYRQDRDRHRDRDRDRPRRHRDPYNPYNQGYSYDPYSPYYQQYHYHYYENLRRTNPQLYAEWYHKMYQQGGVQQTYGNEDRASVHSGRSSANDELAKDRYTRQSYYSQASLHYYREPHTHSISGHYGLDESSRPFDQTDSSLYLDETATQRLTPAKFATAHIKASISSGHLVKIFPHYPLDSQSATVEVSNLHDLLCNDDEYKELVDFPGPLVKGVTHKKTIIEYCENKIRGAICSRGIVDVDSYILMWELLILLLRQNGMVIGTDIAELLMKDRTQQNSRRGSVVSNSSSVVAEGGTVSETSNLPVSETNSSSTSILKEEVVTNKFRDHLLYGSDKEALEWAMKHGLWGHALFLASKLDKRTYANVMTRFANGLPMNDPLQTLYQLLSGKVPAAVTCVADEKWGDWRPHLAMILSNTTQRPELDRKAITTLADTLFSRGSIYAAQFCYLMAQVGFSRYGSEGAKLVLLGSNQNKPFLEFAGNEAIHMTEVYEYACSLSDAGFLIPEFQPYKYLLSTRLADRGLLEKALAYLEKVTLAILQNPTLALPSLITQVCQLADRLKYCDPVEDHLEGDGDLDTSPPDNSWLKDLKAIERDYNMGLITHEAVDSFANETPELEQPSATQAVYDTQSGQESWQQTYLDPQQYQQPWQGGQYTAEQQPHPEYSANQGSQLPDVYTTTEQYQGQSQEYWPHQQQPQWGETREHVAGVDTGSQQQENVEQHAQNDYWNNTNTQREEVDKQPDEDIPRPQISMPNQSKGLPAFDNQQEHVSPAQAKKDSPVKHKQQQDKAATAGWFGGIWNKLSLRPKNQMKLPDDKNPTIVWDENKKKWINLDSEGDATSAELKPPPKMTDMFPSKQQPLAPPSTNSHPDFAYQNANVTAAPQPTMMPAQPMHNPHMMPANHNMLNSHGMQTMQAAPQSIPAAQANEETPVQPKSAQPNMFKLQRNRNIKKAYVDVFNPAAAKASVGGPALPAPDSFGAVPNNGPQMNFFIPAPVSDPNAPTDFLTPAPIQQFDENSQMSRWSSASSLSREVQYYMQRKQPARR